MKIDPKIKDGGDTEEFDEPEVTLDGDETIEGLNKLIEEAKLKKDKKQLKVLRLKERQLLLNQIQKLQTVKVPDEKPKTAPKKATVEKEEKKVVQ